MNLTGRISPHIRDKRTVKEIMWYVVIALLPAVAAGVYFFGFSSLLIIIASVLSAVLTEYIIQKLLKKPITITDGSAVITGLLVALVIPPGVPLWLPVLGSFLAIAIAKHAFGGLGCNIFNPALIGRAFLVISFPVLMTTWILPDGVTGATPLGLLKQGIAQTASNWDLFIGNIGGCIGETSALALLIGGLFLLYKKIISWHTPVGYIGTVALLSSVFGHDPLFNVLAGGIMIGAFFMATDYVTSPLTNNGRLIFGIGCGLLTVIFRMLSSMPEGVMYSILLMNIVTPLIDRYVRPKRFGV